MYFRVQELVASFSSSEPEQQSESFSAQLSTEPDSVNEDTGALKRKKKKDKKLGREAVEDANGNQTTEGQYEGHNTSSNEMELHPNSSSEPEVKKKKKKKKDKRLEENEEPSATDLPNSDSSGYLSDKNGKKRKAQDSEGLHEDPDIPVAKKKKKAKWWVFSCWDFHLKVPLHGMLFVCC